MGSPWEQLKLGEIADITKLAGFEFTEYVVYSESGEVIAIRGLNVKNGTLNLDDVKFIDNSNFSKLERSRLYKGDLIFTYVGTVGEVAVIPEDNKFYLAPNVCRIRLQDNHSAQLLMEEIGSSNFYQKTINPLIATSSQPALSMENIRKFNVYLPKEHEEQDAIGDFFQAVNKLITLQQQKLDLLKQKKQAYLQKMFPRNGEDIPEFRFEWFNDPWEKRKLSTEFKRVNERNDGSLGKDKWISVAKMYFQDPGKVQSNNLDTRTYVMKYGDIAFEGHPNTEHKYGRFVANDIGTGIISELFPIYRHIVPYDNDYWKQAIKIERIMQPIFAKSITSSGNSSNKLDPNHFLREQINIPILEEQKTIGKFFRKLDTLIILNQRKLDLLKKKKQAYLQNMFPEDGEEEPKWRFEEFV